MLIECHFRKASRRLVVARKAPVFHCHKSVEMLRKSLRSLGLTRSSAWFRLLLIRSALKIEWLVFAILLPAMFTLNAKLLSTRAWVAAQSS